MVRRVGVALLVAGCMLGCFFLATQGRRAHAGLAPGCVQVDGGACLTGGGVHFAAAAAAISA